MIKHILFIGLAAVLISLVEGQYDDVRCRCVCAAQNATAQRKVFIEVLVDPKSCDCKTVVKPQPSDPDICNRCQCEWQRRNTTTIKVVVITIICVISLLVLYMLFLLCLDPLMSRRPKTYLEQQNEEVNLETNQEIAPAPDTQSVSQIIPESNRPRTGVISRIRHEANRVKGEQQKWKGTVQEQRKNIFDRHTMLN